MNSETINHSKTIKDEVTYSVQKTIENSLFFEYLLKKIELRLNNLLIVTPSYWW